MPIPMAMAQIDPSFVKVIEQELRSYGKSKLIKPNMNLRDPAVLNRLSTSDQPLTGSRFRPIYKLSATTQQCIHIKRRMFRLNDKQSISLSIEHLKIADIYQITQSACYERVAKLRMNGNGSDLVLNPDGFEFLQQRSNVLSINDRIGHLVPSTNWIIQGTNNQQYTLTEEELEEVMKEDIDLYYDQVLEHCTNPLFVSPQAQRLQLLNLKDKYKKLMCYLSSQNPGTEVRIKDTVLQQCNRDFTECINMIFRHAEEINQCVMFDNRDMLNAMLTVALKSITEVKPKCYYTALNHKSWNCLAQLLEFAAYKTDTENLLITIWEEPMKFSTIPLDLILTIYSKHSAKHRPRILRFASDTKRKDIENAILSTKPIIESPLRHSLTVV